MSDTWHQREASSWDSGGFIRAFRQWRALPFHWHVLAVLVLVVATTLRYQAAVLATPPIEDEGVYRDAFKAVAEGNSPYEVGYFYTPAFAYAGAFATELLGSVPTLSLLRTSNLLGLAITVWCSMAWTGWSWRRQVLLGVIFVCISPAVRLGVLWGNLSFLIIAMLVIGLLVWRRRPILAGLLLGLSVVIKPLGPVAILALGLHRPAAVAGGTRRHLVAAGIATMVVTALTLPIPYLSEMLSFRGKLGTGRNISLQRLCHCFGLEVSPFLIAVAVALITAFFVRRQALHPIHLLCLACAASLFATPILWSHTMFLALPLEALALGVAWHRRTQRPAGTADENSLHAILRRYEFIFIALMVLSLQLAEGVGGAESQAIWVQGVVSMVPAMAPLVLLIFLLTTTDLAFRVRSEIAGIKPDSASRSAAGDGSRVRL